MGNNTSSQKMLNETMNTVSLQVLNENSTNITASSDQENDLTIAGNTGGKISGISQVNSSKINVAALAQSVNDNKLQADLASKLTSALEQKLPVLTSNSKTNQDVQNIVRNNINQNITTKNMMNISATVRQSNKLKILANEGVEITQIAQKNEAEMIISLINDTNNKIINDIKAKTDIDNTVAQAPGAALPDLGFGSMGMIFVLVIIVIVLGGGYYLSTLGWTDMMKPVPLAVMGAMIVSILGGLYMATAPAKDDKKK